VLFYNSDDFNIGTALAGDKEQNKMNIKRTNAVEQKTASD